MFAPMSTSIPKRKLVQVRQEWVEEDQEWQGVAHQVWEELEEWLDQVREAEVDPQV